MCSGRAAGGDDKISLMEEHHTQVGMVDYGAMLMDHYEGTPPSGCQTVCIVGTIFLVRSDPICTTRWSPAMGQHCILH
jgi:hypothetical protein